MTDEEYCLERNREGISLFAHAHFFQRLYAFCLPKLDGERLQIAGIRCYW